MKTDVGNASPSINKTLNIQRFTKLVLDLISKDNLV